MTTCTSKRHRLLGAFLGFVLGLGAPLGWLAWQFFNSQRSVLLPWLEHHLTESAAVYIYMTVATVLVFTTFGFFLGCESDTMAEQSNNLKDTLIKTNAMAMTDALTGVRNARYLHEYLSIEMESAKRYQTPLSCLMLDIDDFKTINDAHGHPAGDIVLINLVKIILQCVRRVDIVGRLGGEEFLVIMPHTSSDMAFAVAERIRQAVQRWPFANQEATFSVTVSLGVAFYPAQGINNKGGLLKAADDALYQSKRSGKNKVVMMEEAADFHATGR